MIFSTNLRRFMKRDRVKQKDLVKALKVVQGAVSGWVNGRTPDFPNQQKLAKFFRVSVADLFTDPDAAPAGRKKPGPGSNRVAYGDGESSEVRELRDQFNELISTSPEAVEALKPILSYLQSRKRGGTK